MKILGIESSHDDTSLAILENGKIIDMFSISQVDIFKEFGGTVPELASREHVKNINILQKIILEKYDIFSFDYIAYTEKPGLIGALQVGFLFASAISLTIQKKLIPVNHLDGHLFSAAITNEIKYPALCLLVSGGHTQLIIAENPCSIEIIGETLDDAVGEVYDKIASRTNLGFPGGPIIDRIYTDYKGEYINFTKPQTNNDLDFSFSGLKSQVLANINSAKMKNEEVDIKKIVSSFQKTAIDYLILKTKKALTKHKVETLILGGGVSANKLLRQEFLKIHHNVILPELKYATDNGAMIAQAAFLQIIYKNKN